MTMMFATLLLSVPALAAPPPLQPPFTLLSPGDAGRMRAAALESWLPRFRPPETRAAWDPRRALVRRGVLRSLGLDPLPERPPLDPHAGGTIRRDGYLVTRMYWQSLPGIYASGYLYLPERRAGRLPAILHPHGHWANGARHPTVQARLIGLARLGFIGLAVDSVHRYDYAIGLSPLTLMTWNNIRGIDYLLSRDDVDPARIGVTGASGGGQQTMYVMAIEDRIAAAAPIVLISEFREIILPDFTHCRCNHIPGVMRFDQPEICAVFAPKPAFYISDTGDWTKRFPERGFPEIRAIYRLLGAEDRVALRHHDCGHDYNRAMREQVYAFFDRTLRGGPARASIPEPEFAAESLETLAALDDPPPGALDPQEASKEMRARLAGRPEGGIRAACRSLWREDEAIARDGPIDARLEGEGTWRGSRLLGITFASEGTHRIPGLLVLPAGGGPHPAAIIVHPKGKAAVLEDGVAGSLVRRGIACFAIDPRYVGEHAGGRGDPTTANDIIIGRSEAASAAHDIARAAQCLRARSGIAGDRIAAVALGDLGPEAILAELLAGGFAAIACEGMDRTYAAGREVPFLVDVLRIGDIGDLAAAVAPTPVRKTDASPGDPAREDLAAWIQGVLRKGSGASP
ncbi:MAG: acetylxylan esterase [Planctomycetes bacterium]|nr:acetylxylan esterase [Planctomycetota bacterium]